MSKSLAIRIRTSVFSIRMLASVFIGVVMLTWYFMKNLILYNIHIGSLSIFELHDIYLNSIFDSHARSGFDLFAPILAVLPASTVYCDDYSSGYIRNILIRQRRNIYARETFICSTVAGGLSIFLPCLISSLFYILVGEPNLKQNLIVNSASLLSETIFSELQFVWGGLLVVFFLLFLAFLFGAVWSNFGLCISIYAPNRYIALASPFAIYFALHLLLYRTHTFLLFSPVNMLMADAAFIPNLLFPVAYQVTLLLSELVVFLSSIYGRLQDV